MRLLLTVTVLRLACAREPTGPGTAPITVGLKPLLGFSTYLGGSEDDMVRDLVADGAGNVIAVGGTKGGVPTTPGAFDRTFNGGTSDAFIAKFNASGSLLWAAYLGGPDYDRIYALRLTAARETSSWRAAREAGSR